MTPFNIVSLADFLTETEINTVLESFANFYSNVTSKHQRRIKLYMIAGDVAALYVEDAAKRFSLEKIVEIIPVDSKNLVKSIYQSASVMFLPLQKNIGEIIPEALAFGLPILCYDTDDMKEYLDYTCGMFVRPKIFSRSMVDFADKIRMLYFDPEVRKLLKKGAKRKFGITFGWKRYEGIEMASAAN